MSINIPDPQVVEMEALDKAFYDWIEECAKIGVDSGTLEWYLEDYQKIDADPLVFTQDDMYESYDPSEDYEGGNPYGSAFAAMERDMGNRIDLKRKFLQRINEENNAD